jgi:chromosome partitioning protein
MILLIGGEKGGTGKSTIATNLAAWLAQKGADVLILDSDPQTTAAKWVARRTKNFPDLPIIHCLQKTGDIYETIKDVSKRYKEVIIDAGGRDSEELRTAMLAVRKLYIPIRASQPDLETMTHMSKLIAMAKSMNHSLEAYVILSIAPTNPLINEAKEAKELLGTLRSVILSSCIIRDRKSYRDAISEGRGVVEAESGKAKTEMTLLAAEIYG